jgi:hypothetical protein
LGDVILKSRVSALAVLALPTPCPAGRESSNAAIMSKERKSSLGALNDLKERKSDERKEEREQKLPARKFP